MDRGRGPGLRMLRVRQESKTFEGTGWDRRLSRHMCFGLGKGWSDVKAKRCSLRFQGTRLKYAQILENINIFHMCFIIPLSYVRGKSIRPLTQSFPQSTFSCLQSKSSQIFFLLSFLLKSSAFQLLSLRLEFLHAELCQVLGSRQKQTC